MNDPFWMVRRERDEANAHVRRLQDENERLSRLLRGAINMLDGAQSGYISCSRDDEQWNKEKDELLAELRAFFAQPDPEKRRGEA